MSGGNRCDEEVDILFFLFLDAKHGAGERQGSFARNGRDWEGLMHWVGMDGVRDRRDLAWSMEHGA